MGEKLIYNASHIDPSTAEIQKNFFKLNYKQMKHLQEAQAVKDNPFIHVKDQEVKFIIQDGPIGEVGVNGCQASDMLEYVKELFVSLNNAFPCEENKSTIAYLDKAMFAQEQRTADREARNVEGKSEA